MHGRKVAIYLCCLITIAMSLSNLFKHLNTYLALLDPSPIMTPGSAVCVLLLAFVGILNAIRED